MDIGNLIYNKNRIITSYKEGFYDVDLIEETINNKDKFNIMVAGTLNYTKRFTDIYNIVCIFTLY